MGACPSTVQPTTSYSAVPVEQNEDGAEPLFVVFKSTSSKCKSVKSCECIKRMTNALQYYNNISFNRMENDYDELLITLCHVTYKSLLDDYIHIIAKHNNDLLDIFDIITAELEEYACSLSRCNINHCKMLNNKYNAKLECKYPEFENSQDLELELIFYTDIMDSMHCYLLHLYDIGMRINIQYKLYNDVDSAEAEDRNNDLQCFDSVFAEICQITDDKKNELQRINGYRLDHGMVTNKFNIDIAYFDTINRNELFIDKLFIFMLNNEIERKKIKQLFITHEYDSDAVIFDINSNDSNDSNINQCLQDTKDYEFELIKMYLSNMYFVDTHHIGFKFVYWNYYKNEKENHDQYKQIFISFKYSSLKEEILTNRIYHIELREYEKYVNKATKYMHSTQIKKTLCWVDEDPLHFGIEFGTKLSLSNVLSIILYCDSIRLSRHFSSIFERNNNCQTIESIANKACEFWHWSKLLTETVEYFGESFVKTNGSVYCGLPSMIMSQFDMKLNGAISTTKHIEILCMKCNVDENNNGIIVELNDCGTWHDFSLYSFCCSWISHYPEDNEYLFFGGNYRIKIQSILNIETKQNFSAFFSTLFAFQFMVNGNETEDFVTKPYVDNCSYNMLNNLIRHKLKINGFKNNYPKYINYTFKSFTNSIKEIVLNFDFIEKYFKKIKDLIIYPINNNPKEIIWKLFPNIKYVLIYSTDRYGQYAQYPIDLGQLLCVLSKTSLFIKNDMQIILKATHKYQWDAAQIHYEWEKRSWLFDAYYSESMETEFRNKNFYVDFKETGQESDIQRKRDCLTITKFYQK